MRAWYIKYCFLFLIYTVSAHAVDDHAASPEVQAILQEHGDSNLYYLNKSANMRILKYNPEKRRCEEFKDSKDKIQTFYLSYSPSFKTTVQEANPNEIFSEEDGKMEIEIKSPNAVLIDHIAHEEGGFNVGGAEYVVIQDVEALSSGTEEESFCVLKGDFEKSIEPKNGTTQFTYQSILPSIVPPMAPELMNSPGFVAGALNPAYKPAFRKLIDNLGQVPAAEPGARSLSGIPEGAVLHFLPKDQVPKSVPSWASAFVIVPSSKFKLPKGTPSNRVYYLSDKILKAASRETGGKSAYIHQPLSSNDENDNVPKAIPWDPARQRQIRPIEPKNTPTPTVEHQALPRDATPDLPPPAVISDRIGSWAHMVKSKIIDYRANIEDLELAKTKDYAPLLGLQKDWQLGNFGIGLSQLRRDKGKLVQMPLLSAGMGNYSAIAGPCQSIHYNPDKGSGIDAFASPTTSCLFMGAIQEWMQNANDSGCSGPDEGCRVMWGDISHDSILGPCKAWGHKSHNQGLCIDIRPMRDGKFVEAGLTFNSASYSFDRTKRFIKMMRKWGATTVLFNDPKMISAGLSTYSAKHSDHLHVCFPESQSNKRKCINDFKPDPNVCPELHYEHWSRRFWQFPVDETGKALKPKSTWTFEKEY